jgi:hypothetical protein
MKYVWIILAVILLVRIDLVMRIFDQAADKFSSRNSTEIAENEIQPNSEIVSITNDPSLKVTPKKIFLSMLDDFHASADLNIKLKALEFLKTHPTLFNDKLDKDLEIFIYRWRDLVLQKNKVTYDFLIELMKQLKGENLEMLQRFFTLVIDNDINEFFNAYQKTSDTNCMIIKKLVDVLPEEEAYNELAERLTLVQSYVSSDKINPSYKVFAELCLLVLKLDVEKRQAVLDVAESGENQVPATVDEPKNEAPPISGSEP